jgi:predicted transcriptional regulator
MRSICDIFPKLIISENTYNAEANFTSCILDFEKTRNETITKLFKKLNLTMNIEAINNIVNACIELLENRSILEFLVSEKPILSYLFVNLSNNLNATENSNLSTYNYKEILILVLNILKDSIIDNISIPMLKKNEENEQEEFQTTPIGEFILENLPKILANFEIVENSQNLLDTTFGVSTRTIGITRYLKFIFN